ncbi:MAG: hypothetical protein FD123_793 [Bacteroidetes bacterium]|nr:MAG: hypothetical protein FD123_793 [Bacteroidota bacterium]
MAKKEPGFAHQDKLAFYKKLVSFFPEAELKGATMPYTSCNGNMFSFMNPEGKLAIRLSADDRDTFMKKQKTGLMEAHGTIMKEYVEVPDQLLLSPAKLKTDFGKSLAYVKSLKPKATKK